MKVYELIKMLQEMPFLADVKIDNGEYLEDINQVIIDERGYVIIHKK